MIKLERLLIVDVISLSLNFPPFSLSFRELFNSFKLFDEYRVSFGRWYFDHLLEDVYIRYTILCGMHLTTKRKGEEEFSRELKLVLDSKNCTESWLRLRGKLRSMEATKRERSTIERIRATSTIYCQLLYIHERSTKFCNRRGSCFIH